MSRKPTYNELEKKIAALEKKVAELEWSKNAIQRSEARLKEDSFSGIIGRDPKMKDIFDMIKEISEVNMPVLIQGESGTGKELVARAIHNQGPRAHKAFVPVNCGALPEGLLESELFGHVKGAFTGALRDRKGRFEMANGGTLFLDEIADLSKVMQAKLLRVLQEGKFEQVGGEKTISVDVRIISAANRNLKHGMEKGDFRDDLYYRISVVPILIPPLRKRKDDIPLLVDHFLKQTSFKGQHSKLISENALAIMIDYPWPGNVRELQSAIHYALIKSKGKTIQPVHLPLELKAQKTNRLTGGPSRRLEHKIVKEALIRSGGNKAKAARFLGVGRATLYRFLRNFPNIASNIHESE
jgi:sigma-54 dependent transcriptional regulator, acetoin dehydrogenase operon transcriptional activator AcoR